MRSEEVWCIGVIDDQGNKEHHINEDFNVIKAVRLEAIRNKRRHTTFLWKANATAAAEMLMKLNDNQYKLEGE